MRQVVFYLIIVILVYAIYSAFNLSLHDYRVKNVCPKVMGIPACYLALISFILVLSSHVFSTHIPFKLWFFIFINIPLLLALGGTLMELNGHVICPRTSNGTPLCFYSLGICLTILVLKCVHWNLINQTFSKYG